jgi:hypothetical protein
VLTFANTFGFSQIDFGFHARIVELYPVRRPFMSLRSSSLLASAFVLSFAISGCNKSADQSAQNAANNNGSSPAANPAMPADSSNAPSRVPEAAKPIVVPENTPITVVLDQTIGSKVSTSGETFAATVHAPVEADGTVVIPKGARATGIVREAKPAGRFKGGAVLSVALTSIRVNGRDYEIKTSAPSMASKGKGKRSAVMVGGGAGGGALIGGLAGGGKGALIGGLIGAGAGTAGAGLTGNRDITLRAETALTFKLLQPLEVKQR